MATTNDLVRAVAAVLVQRGVGVYAEGALADASSLPLIAFKFLPTTPDRLIVLTAVVQNEDLAAGAQVMLQVRCRGAKNAPLDVDDIADGVRAVLHDLQGLSFGADGGVSQLIRRTSIPNGEDDQRRAERIDQFYGWLNFEETRY